MELFIDRMLLKTLTDLENLEVNFLVELTSAFNCPIFRLGNS